MSDDKKDTGVVKIHGKDYHTVAKRIHDFWEDHPDWSIKTSVENNAEEVLVKVRILDEQKRVRSTGHASETRGSSTINKLSALENCETSACGRALAFLGYAGTEIASDNELASAAAQLKTMFERVLEHNQTLRLYMEQVDNVMDYIDGGDLAAAKEAWSEIPQESQIKLWLATTKGGIFTTEHRKVMKSDEWTAIDLGDNLSLEGTKDE